MKRITPPKLTAAQLECLAEMAKPDAKAHYMPYLGWFRPHPYWFVSTDHKKRTKQVQKLIDLGLLTSTSDGLGDTEAKISVAGRKRLRLEDK